MRIRLPVRLALFLFLLTGIGVVMMTYLSYQEASEALEKHSLTSIENDLEKQSILLESQLEKIQQDVNFLSRLPGVRGLIRALQANGYDEKENVNANYWFERLSVVFSTILKDREIYSQIRLVGIENAGRELLRVHRKNERVVVVGEEDLQSKGETEYFKSIIKLQEGEIYYSRINYNREYGELTFPLQPVLRVGMPVFSKDKTIFGFFIINVNFRKFAKSLYMKNQHSFYFLTDEDGNYIVHPDNSKELASEFDDIEKISIDYPINVNEFVQSDKHHQSANLSDLGIGISIHRVEFDNDHSNRFFILGSETSYDLIRADSLSLLRKLLLIAGIIMAIFILVTTAGSHLLTRRLMDLKNAADRISEGAKDFNFRLHGNDEIGDLARSFKTMLDKVFRSKQELIELTESLETKVKNRTRELEYSNDELSRAKKIAEYSTAEVKETLIKSEKLRRDAEQAREKALISAKEADAANRIKSEFLANMTHELRTPMHAILAFSDMGIKRAGDIDTKKVIEYFQTINTGGNRLLALLDDLLDLAKLESGNLNFTFTHVDIYELTKQCMKELDSLVQNNSLMIEIDKQIADSKIWCDGDKVVQVILNILSNAIRFSPAKGVIEIRLSDSELFFENIKTESINIEIIDQGEGIPAPELESIFDKFVQSSKTQSGSGGTGLGLAICKEIVLAHKGQIWAENAPEGGAILNVRLPKKQIVNTE